MPRHLVLLGLLASFASAAIAQNNRSAVSVAGLDTNPCTVTSPCRSFTSAMAVTNPSGEIIALDSAGYGPFTIGEAVTISGAPGVHAAISVTTGTGIAVDADKALDRVILRNLVLIGAGGDIGIDYIGSESLRIIGCLIRGFQQYAVHSEVVTSAAAPDLSIDHTAVRDNGGYGVYIDGGTYPVRGTFTDSSFEGNATGIHVDYNADVVVSNCRISNSNTGLEVISTLVVNGSPSYVMVENSTVSHNGIGIFSNGSGSPSVASVAMSQLVLAYNTTATAMLGAGAEIRTFGNNRFVSNGADGSGFLSQPFQ